MVSSTHKERSKFFQDSRVVEFVVWNLELERPAFES